MNDLNYRKFYKLYEEHRTVLSDEEVLIRLKESSPTFLRPHLFTFSRNKMVNLFKKGFLSFALVIKSFKQNEGKYLRLNVIFSPQEKINEDLSLLYDIKTNINRFITEKNLTKKIGKDKKLFNVLMEEESEPHLYVLPSKLNNDNMIYLSTLFVLNESGMEYEDRLIPIIYNPDISKDIIIFPKSIIDYSIN